MQTQTGCQQNWRNGFPVDFQDTQEKLKIIRNFQLFGLFFDKEMLLVKAV